MYGKTAGMEKGVKLPLHVIPRRQRAFLSPVPDRPCIVGGVRADARSRAVRGCSVLPINQRQQGALRRYENRSTLPRGARLR